MLITRKLNSKTIFLIVLFSAAVLLAACSAPAEKLNQEGNQAFNEQAYLEALELYQSAQIESPELAEPYFNAANTFYRQGDYPAALEQMQMALQYIDEESLAENSLYNIGNTLYNSQDLNQAVDAYTQALLLDPEDQDAKYNLELALQQQEQDHEQQESESESEEDSQSQDQSGEDQESENDQEQEQGDQSEEDQNQDQDGQSDESEQSQEQDQQNDGDGQPQEGEDSPEGEQPSQIPPPGQRMTEEQARQLLAAIANDMQTLQERLGQYLFTNLAPPTQDW